MGVGGASHKVAPEAPAIARVRRVVYPSEAAPQLRNTSSLPSPSTLPATRSLQELPSIGDVQRGTPSASRAVTCIFGGFETIGWRSRITTPAELPLRCGRM